MRRALILLGFLVLLSLPVLRWLVNDYWEGAAIQIIVPDQFRGVFRIAECEDDLVPSTDDDTVTYVIPDDFLLCVADLSPFRIWHDETMSYANGKPIPQGFLLKDDDTAIGYWSWSEQKQIDTFVGTRRSFLAFDGRHRFIEGGVGIIDFP